MKLPVIVSLVFILVISGCSTYQNDNNQIDVDNPNITELDNKTAQYNTTSKTDSGECSEVIPGHNNLNENRINVIFIGFGYDESDFNTLIEYAIDPDANNNGILNFEPFRSNKEKFNFLKVNYIKNNSYLGCSYGNNDIVRCIRESRSIAESSCPQRNLRSIGLYNEKFRSGALFEDEYGLAIGIPSEPSISYEADNTVVTTDTKVEGFCSDLNSICGGRYTEGPKSGDMKLDKTGDGCIDENDIPGIKSGLHDMDEDGKISTKDLAIAYICARRVNYGCDYEIPQNQCNQFTVGNKAVNSLTHEFGHLIGELSDEYMVYGNEDKRYADISPLPPLGENCFLGQESNCNNPAQNTQWGDLLGQGNGKSVIGCFSGCAFSGKDSFRATETSIMKDEYLQPLSFGLVNERIICQKIKELTGGASGYCASTFQIA